MQRFSENFKSIRDFNYISISYSLFGGYILNYDSISEGVGVCGLGELSMLSVDNINKSLSKEDRLISFIIGFEDKNYTILNLLEIDEISNVGCSLDIRFKNGNRKLVEVEKSDFNIIRKALQSYTRYCRYFEEGLLKINLGGVTTLSYNFNDFFLYIEEKNNLSNRYNFFHRDGEKVVESIKSVSSEYVTSINIGSVEDSNVGVDAELNPLIGVIEYKDTVLVFNSSLLGLVMTERGYALKGDNVIFYLGKCGKVVGKAYILSDRCIDNTVLMDYVNINSVFNENTQYINISKKVGGL